MFENKTFCNQIRKSSEATFISLTEYSGPRLFIPFLRIMVFWDEGKYRISLYLKKKCLNLCFQKKMLSLDFFFRISAFCTIFCSPRCSHWQISRIKWYSWKFFFFWICFQKCSKKKNFCLNKIRESIEVTFILQENIHDHVYLFHFSK